MFCSKCGNQMEIGSKFCEKCGTQAIVPESATQAVVEPPVEQAPQPYVEPTRKSGFRKLISIGFGVAVIVSILVAVFGGGTDYVELVETTQPYISDGSILTIGQVVDRLIATPRWSVRRESRDLVFVDLQGRVTDVGNTSLQFTLTFRVTPVEGRDEWYWIDPILLEMNDRLFGEYAANQFQWDLFSTIEGGFGNLLEYFLANGYMDGIFQYFLWNY